MYTRQTGIANIGHFAKKRKIEISEEKYCGHCVLPPSILSELDAAKVI